MPIDKKPDDGDQTDYDALVVGAGFAGLKALHTFREEGLRVRVIEDAPRIGGTWYWNRYPGARVDIESMEYCYSFSNQLQQEWRWPEKYSPQSDVLAYLEWVCDRLDLGRDIDVGTRVEEAAFDEQTATWIVTTSGARVDQIRVKYLILATGFLSAPVLPDIPGLDSFAGRLLHTGRWPTDEVDLSGRVGVIGTGASGVQVIQTLAGNCEQLVVFLRTPPWAFPLRNEPITLEYERYVKDNYAEIRRLEKETRGPGMVLMGGRIELPETRSALEVSPEERRADYERRWRLGGLHMGRSFTDLIRNRKANDTLREFLEEKIREVVNDPALAERLIPDHPPLSRRPPGEQGFYEAFNRDDVTVVDVKADPIARATPPGLVLESGAEHELDALICATGFDGGSGPALRIHITGRGGESIQDHWSDGVRTHLGLMISGFPNMFLINGPQTPSAHFVPPVLAELQTDWIMSVINNLGAAGRAVEPSPAVEEAWEAHVNDVYNQTLIPGTKSWWIGTNVEGKVTQALAYGGGYAEYARRCALALEDGRDDFLVDGRPATVMSGA